MYNFLKDARTIRNSFLCTHDTLDGYASDFHVNGSVDGWDVYNSIYLYGCWSSVLFGTSYARSCYIGRSTQFVPLPAEYFYYVKIMMKITNRNPDKAVGGLTTGRIQWTTLSDGIWNSSKQMDFAIEADDEWRLYTINMGPAQWWQGNIVNLRVFPFLDGWPNDQFAIKYIKIGSTDVYKCANTQCSYYVNYRHPCPGAGNRGICEAGVALQKYTTVLDVSDSLIVNIDNYGPVEFDIGDYSNLDGPDMARVIAEKISSLNVGGYAYVECEYTEFEKLKIFSGVVGSESSITVSGSAAEVLGFFNGGLDISTRTVGTNPATGFDYASSRLLTAREINRLVNGYYDDVAYIHNPIQYNLEGGRRDYNTAGGISLLSSLDGNIYYDSLNNTGKTLIDISHPFNSNGRLKHLYLAGKFSGLSKIKILRPHSDNTLSVVHSFNLPTQSASYMYTTIPAVYRIDCDVLVNRGDLIGIYNADVYVGVSVNGLPDATFFQIGGDVAGRFDPGLPYAFGVAGFAIYGRGDRYQSNVRLDIDLGDRVNIEQVNIYGREDSSYFEFNLASCLDLTWDVDLFGQSHYHAGVNWLNGEPFVDIHTNIYYGKDCLDDCVRTADNGQVGTGYGKDGNGLYTTGANHSYFYVNGDAEWLYTYANDGKHEYSWARVPGSAWGSSVTEGIGGFIYDPIAFTLKFPYGFSAPIHKSIIYFKERDNFRGMALSYYLGQYNSTGNADDNHYQYVPSYTSVLLDGVAIINDPNNYTAAYVYVNPMDDQFVYANGDSDPINWREAGGGLRTSWNVIEHNFNPIGCAGFRIYTDHHLSTKIAEMEVYSRMAITPSLIDNVSMIFSDYGEVWNVASFSAEEDNKISAFIGGAPRYLTIEFDSATKFALNEIEFLVGDQVKIENCDNIILLDHAKRGEVSQSTSTILENVYGRSLDLIVDLPKETTATDDVVFWSRMHSQEDLDSPQIGPPCKLYKIEDVEIGNANYQCAINVPAYGLKNLVHGKEAYVNFNDANWEYYGILSSGVSVDFCNTQYREIVMSLPVESSDLYWKIDFTEVSASFLLRDVILYHDDDVVEISEIFKNSTHGIYKQAGGIVSDGVDITPQPTISGGVCFGFKLRDGVIPVNKIKLIYTTTYVVAFDILTSNNNLDNYIIRCGLGKSGTTDQTVSSGVANAVDYYGTSYPIKAFDNNLTTYWESNTQGWPKWIGYDFGAGNAKAIIKARMYIQHGAPNSLVIQGSNDTSANWNSKVWTNIDTWAGATTLATWHTTVFWNTTSYRFYRFYVATDIFTYWWAIDEIEFCIRDSYAYPSVTMEKYNSNFDVQFAIDLEKRHDLSIIRNYGFGSNKMALSLSLNVSYSNTNSSNIEDVVWGSTYNDARWIKLNLLGGDGTTRCLRKLGIYPDISSIFCRGGGYNCEWEPLGIILSDYTPSINIAYGATVTGTNNYFYEYYPTNAVDGVATDYNMTSCWGFQTISGVSPYLELDFGSSHTINKVILYHGYNPADSSYMNTAYTISVSPTASGSFTTVFTKSGNTEFTTTHQFNPVEAQRIRLTITGYNTQRLLFLDEDTGEYFEFLGSFLREMEVYTYVETGYVDSETWPIVCMNLTDQFAITDHDLVNKDVTDTSTDWDNAETYFRYSDDTFDDPQKVTFADNGETVTVYQKTVDPGNLYKRAVSTYLFDNGVYFAKGNYSIEWDSKSSGESNNVGIRLEGISNIDVYTAVFSTSYVHQLLTVEILESGFYNVWGVFFDEYTSSDLDYWAIRNPIIYRSAGLRKWIAVTRDTATNYGTPSGIDYLSLIRVYGDEEYKPFEYYWWWNSSLSTLSNDALRTMVGRRSLKISYPTGSGIDTLTLQEGDSLSADPQFDSKDFLHFWWYIDDISKLDTSFGDFKFGAIYESDPLYYQWNISSLSLSSGWNDVNLKFEDADYFYPVIENSFDLSGTISDDLNFRTNDRDMKSFVLTYRGAGQSFNMYLDDLKIKRNIFDEDVKFGKGLFLNGYDYLDIPVSTVSLEHGTVEFWMKPFFNYYGADIFDSTNSRVMFTIVNNNNDIISLGIESAGWLMPLVGKIQKDMVEFVSDSNAIPPELYINRNDVIHIALVWSNDGSFMDNGDTIRLYINNELVSSSKFTWLLDDTKAAIIKLGGPNTQLAYNFDIWGGGIFENIKIHNYCKTTFNINYEGVEKDLEYTPNDFLQISQDDINFYGVGSAELPFVFEQVPNGDSKTIYIRANKTERFKQSKSSATLIVEWLSSV